MAEENQQWPNTLVSQWQEILKNMYNILREKLSPRILHSRVVVKYKQYTDKHVNCKKHKKKWAQKEVTQNSSGMEVVLQELMVNTKAIKYKGKTNICGIYGLV